MSVTASGTLRLSQPAGRWAMVATALGAALFLAGGLTAWLGIRRPKPQPRIYRAAA